MENKFSSPSGRLCLVGEAAGGRVRHVTKHPASGVLLSCSRHKGSCSGRSQPRLAGAVPVCFPAVRSSPQSVGEGEEVSGVADDIGGARLAQELLAPNADRPGGTAHGAPTAPSHSSAAPQRGSVRHSSRASADCVAVIRRSLERDRYRPSSIAHLLKARTDGTMAVTKSRWRAWYEWCKQYHVDPLHCTTPELCDFLASLFDSGKAVATIRGYLSAIATTIRLSTRRI